MAKKVWKNGKDGGTPITAAELNRIEKTLDGAVKEIEEIIQTSIDKVSLHEVDKKLNRRVDEVDKKVEEFKVYFHEQMSDVVEYLEGYFVKETNLEQSIVDIVQKRFGIEPSQ